MALKHLVIHPKGGLCNRLRAIASSKRLCQKARATCTVIWEWGDPRALFDEPDLDWRPALTDEIRDTYHTITHRLFRDGGAIENRRVPLTTHERILVHSLFVFGAEEEPALLRAELALVPWIPKVSPEIRERVATFAQERFGGTVVGLHLRRTDHTVAIDASPDELYFREADPLVHQGCRLFIASDNMETVNVMRARYGSAVIHYEKDPLLPTRWPRKEFSLEDTRDDLIDLHLLAACDFVIGSRFSSFSAIAIALNGSPRCKALGDLVKAQAIAQPILRGQPRA